MKRNFSLVLVLVVASLISAPAAATPEESPSGNETGTASTPITSEASPPTATTATTATTRTTRTTATSTTTATEGIVREVEVRSDLSREQAERVVEEVRDRYPDAPPDAVVDQALARSRNMASRQDGVETATSSSGGSSTAPSEQSNGTAIDGATTLLDKRSETEGNQTYAVLKVHSTETQTLVITDAGGVWKGGTVNQREIRVNSGSTVNIRIPVEEHRGMIGVTVSTQRTLYGVPLEKGGGISPPARSDLLALLSGVGMTCLLAYLWVWYRDRSLSEGVVRVDGG